MSNKKIDPFKDFFKDYSKNVDNASSQFFWKLSDEIILAIINKNIGDLLTKDSVIFDAGGGTGRWIQILCNIYPSKFVLYDKSLDMLEMARKKKDLKNLGNRLKIIQGDVQNMSAIESNSVDFVISIYNTISFIEKPILFIKEIKRILKTNGYGLIMGQGYVNAIASKINNYLADANELKELYKLKAVKWNNSLAPLNVFSKELFENLAKKLKLRIVNLYGIPVFMQPGSEDFDSENKLKSRISSKLQSDREFYQEVFNIEMRYNSQDSVINRGMNLMIVVQKK